MNSDFDATVLAAAGVDRLGFGDAVSDRLSFDVMLPAPGQGALAVQCRADDGFTLDLLQAMDDLDVRKAALAERVFLASLGGGCAAPVGALAEVQSNGSVTMRAVVARPDGSTAVHVEGVGPDGPTLGADLAARAVKLGAQAILDDAREALAGKLPLNGKRIVVTRATGQDEDFCSALSGLGATPIRLPMIRIEPIADTRSMERLAGEISPGDWVVFTSANGVSAVQSMLDEAVFKKVRVAAVGRKTAIALEARSIAPDYVPVAFTGEAIGEGLPDVAGRAVWLLRAETAGEAIADLLTGRGAVVHDIPVYRTEAEPIDAAGLVEIEKGVDVVTFTSGSTARNFKTGCESAAVNTAFLKNTVIACIGPVTAEAACELGFSVRVVAEEHTTSGLVDALVTYFSEVL
jgi:uroporphyrinogen-III synthase